MSEASHQSLLAATKLMSKDFTAEERQFAGNLAFKLRGRISARREIAGGGGEELGMSINPKLKIGVSIGSTVIKKAIPMALKWILPGIAGAAMFIAGASIGVVSVVAGIVGLVVFGGAYLLELRAKNKIKAKAEIYKDYFPRDNNVIKLLSQLLTLSLHKELQASALEVKEKHTLWQHIKSALKYIVHLITAKKSALTKEQKKIITLVESEFDELWDIFKDFTRNPKNYAAFKENSLSKQITALFEGHFDLGDPNDRSEIINDRAINALWINVFARYLADKDLTMQARTMMALRSKLNTLAAPQADIAPSFQRDINDVTLPSRVRRASSPQFFPAKPILDSDADEQHQNLHAMPQVN